MSVYEVVNSISLNIAFHNSAEMEASPYHCCFPRSGKIYSIFT